MLNVERTNVHCPDIVEFDTFLYHEKKGGFVMIVTEVLLANLEKIRSRRGWTKDDLCKQMGIGRSTLHAWESGKSKPGMDTLELISKKLNVTLSDLLNENYDPGADSTTKPTDTKGKVENYKERFRAMQANFDAEFSILLDFMMENGL